MASLIEFETPENVRIGYHPAGLGTRFTAWLLDSILVTLLSILLGILALFVGAALGLVADDVERRLGNSRRDPEAMFLIGAIVVLLWGFGSFIYFTLCELLWRGQTVGKRHLKLRVVKIDGFALDATSILLRNVFRVVDQLPLFWIVPVLSPRSQRFGDMAAGTLVVAEALDQLSDLRGRLLARSPDDKIFSFDGTMLSRAKPADVEAVERILERWPELPSEQKVGILALMVDPIAKRLGAPPPDPAQRYAFLQDLLTAIYRRDARRLG